MVNMRYNNDNGTPSSFIAILLAIILILLVINGIANYNKYNNGVCSWCGGTFKYEQAVGHRYETRYLYICDKCGRSIEISQYYPPK